jgi:hypothetical protein
MSVDELVWDHYEVQLEDEVFEMSIRPNAMFDNGG